MKRFWNQNNQRTRDGGCTGETAVYALYAGEVPSLTSCELARNSDGACGCETNYERSYERSCERSCERSDFAQKNRRVRLAMTDFPMQNWAHIHEISTALTRGTIFKALDLPFYGRGVNRRG